MPFGFSVAMWEIGWLEVSLPETDLYKGNKVFCVCFLGNLKLKTNVINPCPVIFEFTPLLPLSHPGLLDRASQLGFWCLAALLFISKMPCPSWVLGLG